MGFGGSIKIVPVYLALVRYGLLLVEDVAITGVGEDE